MAADPKPLDAPATPDDPLRRLWVRYLKARGARTGLVLVIAFALVAFFAPFLAHRLPIFWRGADGVARWPLIREFFAPSDTTEPLLEKGVNFLMLFIPLALAAWKQINLRLPRLARIESRGLSLFFGALVAATLWASIGGMVVQGGGKDWLHYESPPVPDVDDLRPLSEETFREPADATAGAARRAVERALRNRGLATLPERYEPPANAVAEIELRRGLVFRIQDAIDGPALSPVAPMAAAGMKTLGLADDNLEPGIDAARWNRMLMETAYPGLLSPMRQFRSAFVTLIAASLLVLLGLTYICMAGANQFTLSPRWLLLLLLAGIVALPFQLLSPRHDHTEYRKLAAEGQGWGVFPLIPYGPNEQGFGPRLPPSWYEESPFFGAGGIASRDMLARGLSAPDRPLAKRLSALLDEALPDWRESLSAPDGREGTLAALNSLIATGKMQDPEILAGIGYDITLNPYVNVLRAGDGLPSPHQERLNRLLIERAVPGAFASALAVRWKKPNHSPGVHLLGTDESGRDVLVRILHGARVSLSVGFVSVFLATVIGLVMGSLAAYYGGWTDMAISRFIEIMMCFPSFFLILAVIAVLDKRSIVNIMLVIGLTSWTGMARLVRGEMLRQKKMEYVSASIALGASDTRTIFRHILPNAMAPVLVSISFGITGAILTEAGLSFIGFGVTPPTPTWGQLLSETRESPLANWWLAVFPGVVLFISVVAYNLAGEALRDALDPRTSL